MNTGISVGCEAVKGTFASECFVRIRNIDRNFWEGAVDREMVFELDRPINESEPVAGRMYAYLISFDNESALIELPIEDSTMGRRIVVPLHSIRKEKIPA